MSISEDNLEHKIRLLLMAEPIRSQQMLSERLNELGISQLSQSSLSRSLDKLGAVKVANAHGQVVYQLPENFVNEQLKQAMKNMLLCIEDNGEHIVLKTQAGCASLFAKMLDSEGSNLGVLGSIAGDDTVFVIPESTQKINSISQKINQFFTELE